MQFESLVPETGAHCSPRTWDVPVQPREALQEFSVAKRLQVPCHGRLPLGVSTRGIGSPRGQSVGYGRVSSRSRHGGWLALSLEKIGFGSSRSGSYQWLGRIRDSSLKFFIVV
jgi:hypothetical protein